LALALPSIDENWLSAFSKGLFALADQHNIALIGGDTTKGPMTMSITVFGDIPTGQALRRSQAKVGDDIWVSGTLGDARLALSAMQGKLVLETHAFNQAAVHLHRPTPRIALGMALRDVAHAAIDISDGLLGDLQHVLKQSNVGATLQADDLPLGEILNSTQTTTVCHEFALNGGDDYELCFTAPTTKREAVHQAATKANTVVTRIGQITAAREINILNAAGEALAISSNSYDHFKT
jgi:thiamine-monophosphate kinase